MVTGEVGADGDVGTVRSLGDGAFLLEEAFFAGFPMGSGLERVAPFFNIDVVLGFDDQSAVAGVDLGGGHVDVALTGWGVGVAGLNADALTA